MHNEWKIYGDVTWWFTFNPCNLLVKFQQDNASSLSQYIYKLKIRSLYVIFQIYKCGSIVNPRQPNDAKFEYVIYTYSKPHTFPSVA